MIYGAGRAKPWRNPSRLQNWFATLTALSPPPTDLVAQLCSQGLVAEDARFETLFGGRTNHVWKVLGGDGDKVLKLYRDAPPNPLFRNDAELEATCLQVLAPTGFVPRLRATGHHADERWVFYDHAPGTPWHKGPDRVGVLLSRLHALPVTVDAPNGCNGSADLAQHGQRILETCSTKMRRQLDQLRPTQEIDPIPKRCLIHGDPVAGNILVAPSGLTLIDWQCPALGDPCEDIALFLSPAMQHLYRGAPLTPDEHDQFLQAYGQPEIIDRYRSLRQWYAWRMAAYCLWRAETGAPDYAVGLELELAEL